jgi:hypothetical protein
VNIADRARHYQKFAELCAIEARERYPIWNSAKRQDPIEAEIHRREQNAFRAGAEFGAKEYEPL